MPENETKRYGANLIVESLANHGVEYVFGIPGAKIDRVFDQLDHPQIENAPRLVVTRHEQNAAFMAAGVGRITGKPGVVITTSGPGVSNLATGLLTANAEGDPVLAISGQVQRKDLLRQTHQSIRNADLLAPVTKYSAEVQDPNNISEMLANAYQAAESGKQGASFVSVPQDVTDSVVTAAPIRTLTAPKLGPASPTDIALLAQKIKDAELPVLLLGMRASSAEVTAAVRDLLAVTELPVVETFQGAGIISHAQEKNFFGRVGLFHNQPGDVLLKQSDLIITIGYDPIEYEPRNWNAAEDARVIVIDSEPAQIDQNLQPETELIGDIAQTLAFLEPQLRGYRVAEGATHFLDHLRNELTVRDLPPVATKPGWCTHLPSFRSCRH